MAATTLIEQSEQKRKGSIMKKKVYLFCTNPILFLSEIPPLALLIVSIMYNTGEGNGDLFQLIFFLIVAMIFIVLFLFRYMTVSFDELRCRGPFSSRDSAIINKDKILILTLRKNKNLRVELYGNDGEPTMFGEINGTTVIDYFQFKATAFGGKRSAAKILRFFEVSESDAAKAVSEDGFFVEYKTLCLESTKKENGREIRIRFKETL